MLLYPRAKINWTLNVLKKRADGYHELDMLMQSTNLCDEIEISDAERTSLTVVSETGDAIPTDENNIVLKAVNAVKARFGIERCAGIRLVKRIPAQAGMGGGSADAAEIIKALAKMWNIGADERELREVGFSVGADVPYCMYGGLARVSGRGEIIEELGRGPECALAIIMPSGGLSTGRVFAGCEVGAHMPFSESAERLRARDWEWLENNTFNELQPPAVRLNADISSSIGALRAAGARFARMTGSGAAVYGVFDESEINSAARELGRGGYRVYIAHTIGGDEYARN